jgi:hypothetical protein
MVTREDWAKAFLKKHRWPIMERNLVALIAWEAAEGGPTGARFNPLNCTLKMAGSTAFNWNGGFPVQNYVSLEQGLEATVKTLDGEGLGYGPVRQGLRDNDHPRVTLAAVEASAWGTGGLARSIVDDVKNSYHQYADQPIGQ